MMQEARTKFEKIWNNTIEHVVEVFILGVKGSDGEKLSKKLQDRQANSRAMLLLLGAILIGLYALSVGITLATVGLRWAQIAIDIGYSAALTSTFLVIPAIASYAVKPHIDIALSKHLYKLKDTPVDVSLQTEVETPKQELQPAVVTQDEPEPDADIDTNLTEQPNAELSTITEEPSLDAFVTTRASSQSPGPSLRY